MIVIWKKKLKVCLLTTIYFKGKSVTSPVIKICPNVAGGMIALRLWTLFLTNEN